MALSLIKILFFVAAVALASILASYVAGTGSDVRLQLGGYEIATSPLIFTILLVLTFPAFWLLFFIIGLAKATLNFFLGDENALTRYFDRNREQRGFEALADGLLALSSGEPKLALTKLSRAENLLNRPEITGIIIAQAAEKSGDKIRALSAYKLMLEDSRTRFVGIAGLLRHRLETGDTETALKLAKKAYSINPQHDEMQNTLLRLQSSEEDWEGALNTLATKMRQRKIPRNVFRRRNAILLFASGRKKIFQGDLEEGDKDIIEANKLSPGLIPAAVIAAEAKMRADDKRSASNIIKKAWSIQPHPDLATAFASIEPAELPFDRKQRFEKMVGKSSKHLEVKMLMAELSIADQDYAQARQEIGSLAEEEPTVRSFAIMAAIERGEGSDDSIVRSWLTKAASASRGPQWVCEICHWPHSEWVPVCTRCGGFDTLEWTKVHQTSEITETPASLLTLAGNLPDIR